MARAISDEEKTSAQALLARAREAMAAITDYDQATVDRLCQAIAGATANEATFGRLTRMSVEESGMGSAEGVPARRWKILGILRDALRTKSVGIIEELPDLGIVKYAKPAGVIAGLLPVTNPLVTMVNMAINAVKCKDAVIFSPHPLSKKTAVEIARVIRIALKQQAAPEDLILCLEKPSIPLAQELMSICDLTIATGGPAMVQGRVQLRQARVWRRRGQRDCRRRRNRGHRRSRDEHADQQDPEPRVGLLVRWQPAGRSRVYDRFLDALQKEGGYLASAEEKRKLEEAMWDAEGQRTSDTIARAAERDRGEGRFALPDGKSFIIVKEDKIGKAHRFSGEKLSPVLAIFNYHGFDDAAPDGLGDFRGGRQGALGRHRVVRRRPHPPAGVDGAGEPDHGAPAERAGQRRLVHERHAADRQPRMRHLGRQHHEREHQRQALHEHDLGQPAHP